jgi:hypothetical protein
MSQVAKVGLDDFFAAGHTVADLEALACPWDGSGQGIWWHDASTETDVETLQRELAAARADLATLVQAVLNIEVTRNELIAVVAVVTETLAKQSRGEVVAHGKVVLSAPEIADDWRPKPAKGQRLAPVNPQNGRRPRMSREKVTALMTEAVEKKLIRARPVQVERRHTDGSTYKATDWLIDPVASIADALKPVTTYRLDAPKPRKPRTITPPCPECGEVHPTRQVDYCAGCGAKLDERTIEPKTAEECGADNLSEADSAQSTPVKASSFPAPIRNGSKNSGGTGHNADARPHLSLVRPALKEPDWLQAAPDPWAG